MSNPPLGAFALVHEDGCQVERCQRSTDEYNPLTFAPPPGKIAKEKEVDMEPVKVKAFYDFR